MPEAQFEVAWATYCTVGLTLLPLAGAETETPAKAEAPEPRASKKANFRMKKCSVVGERAAVPTVFLVWNNWILLRQAVSTNSFAAKPNSEVLIPAREFVPSFDCRATGFPRVLKQ